MNPPSNDIETVLPIRIVEIVENERYYKNDEDAKSLSRLDDSQALARLGKRQVLKV